MRSMMGVILTGGKKNGLKELADMRSSAAIPVGGKYRAIDFPLSSMVNSGIINVGVLTQYSFRSLMDHLGSGKEWDLDRRNKGLFVFPPYLSSDEYGWYKGSADAMYNNLTFLQKSMEEYVVVAQGNCVYKIDFRDVLDYHVEKGADITVVYRDMSDFPKEELPHLGSLKLNSAERIVDFEEKPNNPKWESGSMGIYILKRKLLIELLEDCIAHANYDFVKDVLVKKVNDLNMYGFKFDGYWRNFATIQGYYRCNMEMLNPELAHKLLVQNGHIYTKVKDEPPAKFDEHANVKNSIVADGCIIEGTIENCVIFRDVIVNKGAYIKNSIIMQGTVIEEDAKLEYLVVDKNVKISRGVDIKGAEKLPMVVAKNAVL